MNTNDHISKILEDFIADQSVKPNTRDRYYNIVRLFFAWLEMTGVDWKYVRKADVIRFKDRLIMDKKSVRTIRLYLTALNIFFKWTVEYGIMDRNICEGIKKPKVKPGFTKMSLNIEQLQLFLSSIDRSTQIGKRDYAMFVLLFVTGLRSHEAAALDCGDFDKKNNVNIVWFSEKGGVYKDSFKPLTDKTIEAIEVYLLTRDGFQDHWPLFATHGRNRKGTRLARRSWRDIFKKRLKKIGIDDRRITLHSTRHTHGALNAMAGTPIHEIQKSLGHSTSKITEIYTASRQQDLILTNRPGKVIDGLI